MKIRPVRLAIFIILSAACFAFAQKGLVIPGDLTGGCIGEYLSIHEDMGGRLTINDILSGEVPFSANNRAGRWVGITDAPYWIKIDVTNTSSEPVAFYFEFTWSMIDELDFCYQPRDGDTVCRYAGYERLAPERRFPPHTPRFLAIQSPGDQTYYFRVKGETILKAAIRVWERGAFENRLPWDHLIGGLSGGILLSVILYNIIACVWQRRWIYFWFACFATTGVIQLSIINGIGYQLLSPYFPYHRALYHYIFIINEHLSILFCLLFFYGFKTEKKIYHDTLTALLAIAALLSLIFLFPGYRFKMAVISSYQVLSFTIVYGMFVYAFFRYRPFYLVIAGMTCYLIFIFTNHLYYFFPQVLSWMSFMVITIGMVIHANHFHLEQHGLMLSIQHAENVKSEFIHSVAHNLKTPLVALTFASQMLKNILKENAEAQHFLDKILRNTTWLSNFIENFFQFYKNDTFELNLRPVEMKSLINSIAGELADMNRYRHNILFNQAESDTDFYINADKGVVEQVLLNVIENAIKYSTIGNEKGTIIIDMKNTGKELIISVADNGVGISKSAMENIYDAFFRERKDDQHGGTGLGLTICKRFIEAHQGKIDCVSPVPKDHSPYLYLDSERKGALFFIHLPTNLKRETKEDK